MESGFKKLGGLIASIFAVSQIVSFSKAAIELGSDLAEVQNVVDVTFGSLNSEVNEFAKNAVTQFGLSELSAKQFTSTMGAMLKSMGLSTREAADMGMEIAGLAGDMASFYNLNAEDAFYKIRSGISGETEPLKQLGINLSVANLEQYALTQGITKSYKAMTQQEQALLRYNYLLSVTSDAQGDFARTSDSWANQTRILSEQFNSLKASIGQGLISAFTPVLRWINTIIAGLQTVANAFRQVMALLFGKAPGSGAGSVKKEVSGIAGGFGAAADGANELAKGVGAAGKAAKKALLDFDTLKILSDNSGSGSGGNSGGGGGGIIDLGEFSPDAEPIEDTVSPQIKAIVDKILYYLEPLKGISFEPLKAAFSRLKTAFSELGTAGNAFEWVWFNILVPLAKWTIEDFAPDSVDLLTAAISALNDILIALKPFGQWFWNDFLIPIINWASEKLAPASLELFTSAVGALKDIVETLKPYGEWLWEKFLKPIAEWAGNELIEKLGYLSKRLEKIGNWAKEHKDIITAVAKALTYFAAGFLLVVGAVKIWTAVAGIAATVTGAFSSAIAFLLSPVGIAALITGVLFAFTNLMGYGEMFARGIGDILGGIVDIFLAAFTFDIPGILKGFCRFFKGIGEIIWSSALSIADAVANAFDWVVQKLADLLEWAFGEVVETPIEKLEEQGYYEVDDSGYYVNAEDWAKYGEDVFNMPDVTVISPEEIQKMMSEWLEKQKIDGWTYDYENDEYTSNSDSSKTMSGKDGRMLLDVQNGKIGGSPLQVEFASGDVETSLSNLDEFLESGTETAKTAEEVNQKLSEDVAEFQDKNAELETTLNSAADKLVESNSSLITAMNEVASAIAASVSSADRQRSLFSFNIPLPKIPHLAKGTVIPPRAPFLAMLGDQQRGTNVETPVKVIEDAVAKVVGSRELLAAIQEGNSLARDLLYAVSNIDDSKIGKMANRYNRSIDRAYGR